MAVENLGGDVVLNNYFAGINNAYNREQQRVQKETQDNLVLANQQKKELDGLVKGINTNVAREKDVALINKKRSELYDTYYQASKAESTEERLKLKMQLQNQIQDMGQFVLRSKQRASELANLGKQLGDPKNTGLYGADVIERYKKLTNSSSDLINDEDVNPINFRANDFSYLNKTVDAIGKEIFDLTSKTITSAGSMKVGNKSGTVVQTDKTVDPKEFAKALIYKYDNDLVFKNQTDAQTQLLGGQVTPTDYLATLAQTQYEKYKGKGGSQKFEKDVVVKVGGGEGGYNPLSEYDRPQDLTLYYGKGGSATVTGKGTLKFSVPKVNMLGSKVVNLRDGRPDKITKSSTNSEIVTISNYPITTASITVNGVALPSGSLVGDDFAQKNPNVVQYKPMMQVQDADNKGNYLVDLKYMPSNISSTNKKILKNFKSYAPQSSAPVTTAPKKNTPPVKSSTDAKQKITW